MRVSSIRQETSSYCRIDGCGRPVSAAGRLCRTHIYREEKGLELNAPIMIGKYTDDSTCSVPGCVLRPKSRGMCKIHYQRWFRGKPIDVAIRSRPEFPTFCNIDGCGKKIEGKGLCKFHYQRQLTGTDMLAPYQKRRQRCYGGDAVCEISGCDKRPKAKGLCSLHYQRASAGLDMTKAPRWSVTSNRWQDNGGYITCVVPVDTPGAKKVKGASISSSMAEHRYVMQQMLGRPLLSEERPHHKNGDRTDNRLDNLELWSTAQPAGQRVMDKIQFAIELLVLYQPLIGLNPVDLELLRSILVNIKQNEDK